MTLWQLFSSNDFDGFFNFVAKVVSRGDIVFSPSAGRRFPTRPVMDGFFR